MGSGNFGEIQTNKADLIRNVLQMHEHGHKSTLTLMCLYLFN